ARRAAPYVRLRRPLDVVADEQVEFPIPIIVQPGGARAPLPLQAHVVHRYRRALYSSLFGHVNEFSILDFGFWIAFGRQTLDSQPSTLDSDVMKQMVGTEARHVDILPPVAI